MEKKYKKIKIVVLVLIVLLLMSLIVFIVGRSFGFFQYKKKGDVVNVVSINGINVRVLSGSDNALNLVNTYPMYDNEGLSNTPFTFTIENTSRKPIDYTLKVENDTEKQSSCVLADKVTPCTQLPTSYIRIAYSINDGAYSEPKTLGGANNNVIYSETINGRETRKVAIKVWIDKDATNAIQENVFFGKLIISGEKAIKERCDIAVNTVYEFDYNGTDGTDGSVQNFSVPCSGTYKLETWGAQGGSEYGNGGLGGYSIGTKTLTKDTTLYIVVGGQPSSYTTGGYNGGGDGYVHNGSGYYKSAGGGATSIVKDNNRGLLKDYSNNRDEILIVAGGGGGSANYGDNMDGGAGGGLTSGYLYYQELNKTPAQSSNIGADQNGTLVNYDTFSIACGSRTVTAPLIYPGVFGLGNGNNQVSGGGGGYYGGGGFAECGLVYSGGGGSGYIGGVTNGTSTAGQRSGNGYARITYLGND